MRIALINENSQASKNDLIYNELKKVCDQKKYELNNYGMKDSFDNALTYVEEGLLAAILLNTKACDFVVTGCGTGEGAMMALNSFPGVFCGLVTDPTDAYLFSQINAGNSIALPFAKGFGWGSEITLRYIFEKLFSEEFGNGYPKERKDAEQKNKLILENIKKITNNSLIDILKNIDQDFLYETINRDAFKEYFFKYAEDGEVKDYIKNVLYK